MSKSILVIDTPEHCSDCPLLNEADMNVWYKIKMQI